MTMHGRAVLLVLVALVAVSSAGVAQEQGSVVATTPWTAAFARAAGADAVHVLAPYEMQHPPEYELRPSDLQRVRDADIVVYAGYENMMSRLGELFDRGGSGGTTSGPRPVQIATDYSMETLRTSLLKIARELDTVPAARRALERFEAFFEDWRGELAERGLSGAAVIAHSFQTALARELGFRVRGEIGPAPLQARDIAELSRREARLCLDNWHNTVSEPLQEVMQDTRFVELINFPGKDNTRTLLDVLRYNRERMREAIAGS
jgi:hypothetical protein